MNNHKKKSIENYEHSIQKNFMRNSFAVILFEFIWGMGLPFGMFTVLVPMYMSAIGSPKTLIGFVSSLYIILCPIQLVIGYYTKNGKRKKWLIQTYLLAVLPWLFYNIFYLFFFSFSSSSLKITIFFGCILFYEAIITGNHPVYHSMMRDFTPFKKRGGLYGYRVAALALGAVLTSWVALEALSYRKEPQNYIFGFIISNTFMILSLLPLFLVREFNNPQVISVAQKYLSTKEFVVNVRVVLRKARRNPNYLVFIYCAMNFIVSITLSSFVVVYAREKKVMTCQFAVVFVIIQIAISAVGSIGFGKLGDKVGFRNIGIVQAMLLCVGFIFAIIAAVTDNGDFLIYLAFVLCASGVYVGNLVLWHFSFELLPKADSNILISLTNLFLMPAVLLIVPLSGLIIDFTGSFVVVFVLGAYLAGFSAFGFMLIVPEPRTKKIYAIRYIRKI